MSLLYPTIPTTIFLNKLAAASSGNKLQLTYIAIGSGNITPSPDMTELEHEEWRGPVNNKGYQGTRVWADVIVPPEVGGFYVREIGLFGRLENDTPGEHYLLGIARVADTYKPTMTGGAYKQIIYRIGLKIQQADIDKIEFVADPSLVLASREYVDDSIAAERVNTDLVFECTNAELPGILSSIPKNLNGHLVTITTTGLHTLAANLFIKGFTGGTLKINFGGAISCADYSIVVAGNAAKIHLKGLTTTHEGYGSFSVVDNAGPIVFEDLSMTADEGYKISNFMYIGNSAVTLTGTTTIESANNIDNFFVGLGGLLRIYGSYDYGAARNALKIISGGAAENYYSIIPANKVDVQDGGKYLCLLKKVPIIGVKTASNGYASPLRRGVSAFVFDQSGTTFICEIKVHRVIDHDIYFTYPTQATIPNNPNTYVIKLVNSSEEPYHYCTIIGNTVTQGVCQLEGSLSTE